MNSLAKIAISSMLVLSISACVGNINNSTSDPHITAFTQHTPKHLEFMDTSAFDKQLSTAMTNKHYEIQVSMLTPFSTNDVPKKLDTWLTVISNFGGEVKTESTDDAKGLLVPIVLTLVSLYQEYRNQQKYEPAQHYNATVFYKHNVQGVAIVEKIVFSHKN